MTNSGALVYLHFYKYGLMTSVAEVKKNVIYLVIDNTYTLL